MILNDIWVDSDLETTLKNSFDSQISSEIPNLTEQEAKAIIKTTKVFCHIYRMLELKLPEVTAIQILNDIIEHHALLLVLDFRSRYLEFKHKESSKNVNDVLFNPIDNDTDANNLVSGSTKSYNELDNYIKALQYFQETTKSISLVVGEIKSLVQLIY